MDVALLDLAVNSATRRDTESTGEICGSPRTWQLDERQGISMTLRDDLIADGRIERTRHIPQQEGAGIAVDQAGYLQLGNVLKLSAGLARREHDADRLRQQATGDERQRQRRRLIEPLGVIDDAQQRMPLGILCEQAQHPQTNQKAIRRRARAYPKDGLQCLTLGKRQPLEPAEQRRTHLVQAGVRQLHLGLHPHRPHYGHIRSGVDQVPQQRRLTDPSLAS